MSERLRDDDSLADSMRTSMARWETTGGGSFVELYRDRFGYGYVATDGGGYLGDISGAEAFAEMVRRVAEGYFKPDRNKRAMVLEYLHASLRDVM